MRMRHAAVVAGLALGLMSETAKAAYILNFEQTGNNVVATGSGSLDVSQLTGSGIGFAVSLIDSSRALTFVGIGNFDSYSGIIGPSSFDTNQFAQASTDTGSLVGINGSVGDIFVPAGYVSGSDLGTSISVYSDANLSDLGLVAGSRFSYFFQGNGESIDTFTINVGLSSVPLPASAPMFGAALLALGAVGYGVKRKKAAAAV